MRPTVAILGAGSMGEILAGGLLRAGWSNDAISLAARRPERAAEVESHLGVACLLDPPAAAKGREVVVVAVKPRDVPVLIDQMSAAFDPDQVLISLAAGVPIALFEQAFPGAPVIRAMPNTPAFVDEAITAYAAGTHVDDGHLEAGAAVLAAVGKTIQLAENHMDAVTAVSGTGPAYLFLLAEALIDAAIREGLPRHAAEGLVNQTLKGSGALIAETEMSPTELRAQVTSPGGTTAAAVHVLEEGGFRALVEDAVRAAAQRSRELGEAGAGSS